MVQPPGRESTPLEATLNSWVATWPFLKLGSVQGGLGQPREGCTKLESSGGHLLRESIRRPLVPFRSRFVDAEVERFLRLGRMPVRSWGSNKGTCSVAGTRLRALTQREQRLQRSGGALFQNLQDGFAGSQGQPSTSAVKALRHFERQNHAIRIIAITGILE